MAIDCICGMGPFQDATSSEVGTTEFCTDAECAEEPGSRLTLLVRLSQLVRSNESLLEQRARVRSQIAEALRALAAAKSPHAALVPTLRLHQLRIKYGQLGVLLDANRLEAEVWLGLRPAWPDQAA